MDERIDFEAASAAWRLNKRALAGGGFTYICSYTHSDGRVCHKPANRAESFCKKHRRHCRKLFI